MTDIGTFKKHTELYRARVTEVDIADYKDYGAVRVFIPDLMDEDQDEKIDSFKSGLIAYPMPALGGINTEDPEKACYFQGTVMVPDLHSYVWVLAENGSVDHLYYLCAWQKKAAKLPPECTSVKTPHKVRILYKDHSGRAIVMSEDTDTQRVEITGKKRMLNDSEGPSGNVSSVYTIDGNQTTILLDEKPGNEKVLIRTYKGDYLNLDIEKQSLFAYFKNDINIKCGGSLSIDAGKDIRMKAGKNLALTAVQSTDINTGSGGCALSGGGIIHMRSSNKVFIDGVKTFLDSGLARVAYIANPNQPIGLREN